MTNCWKSTLWSQRMNFAFLAEYDQEYFKFVAEALGGVLSDDDSDGEE
jgi:hypothetical protein